MLRLNSDKTKLSVWVGLDLICFGTVFICWPTMTFRTLTVVFEACMIAHAFFVTTRLQHATKDPWLLWILSLQAAMDILTTALIWLYPANDLWTLLLWIPAWSIIIGLLEIRTAKVSEIGLWRVGPWLGATALLFGISISIWPPLVFTFTGAAIIVLGGLLLVSAFRPERNLRDENPRRYHWAPTALVTVVRHMK